MFNLKILKYILFAHLVFSLGSVESQNVTEPIQPPQNETSIAPNTTEPNTTREVETLDMDIPEPDNSNVTVVDHQYYNSTLILDPSIAQQYWIDFENATGVIYHDMLSDSYRRAASVNLSFEFPFYGHFLHNITIATGGFLYMGVYMHTWLAATQYAAPLMGNFDTTKNNDSKIQYYDNGTMFTVEWKDVILRDKPEEGEFTFQVSLFKNGDITFGYQKIPVPVTSINNYSHPVKVGLADAYTVDKHFFFVKRKTIYEYHKIDAKTIDISNNTAIIFKALPTCLQFKDCESCNSVRIGFDCSWCGSTNRCSDGLDRHRQEWIEKGCHATGKRDCSVILSTLKPPTTANISATTLAPTLVPSTTSTSTTSEAFQVDPQAHKAIPEPDSGGMSTGGILTLVGVFLALVLFGGLLIHAYRNPQSDAGQFLIRYRPSQWRISRGQARYTAASIHM